jgi:hypothetical protein
MHAELTTTARWDLHQIAQQIGANGDGGLSRLLLQLLRDAERAEERATEAEGRIKLLEERMSWLEGRATVLAENVAEIQRHRPPVVVRPAEVLPVFEYEPAPV